MLFSGIREIAAAFSKIKVQDEDISRAADIIETRLTESENLGFFRGKEQKDDFETKVLDIITEHDIDLSQERLKILLQYLEKTRNNKAVQSRFRVQFLVSIIVLTACILYLFIPKEVDRNIEKAAIGFIGTVIGYWLR